MTVGQRRAADELPARKGVSSLGIGPILCWAVVFADIGTSVYYTPGILFGQVGNRAPLFVAMTLVVFVLLTKKYAEVAIRYPEGGGVVTVGAHAANSFVGLVGGLLILVAFVLGIATSFLVVLAWVTNLFAKPLATLFGGSVTLVGLAVAGLTYSMQRRRGLPAVVPLVHRLEHIPHIRDGHPTVLVLLDASTALEAEAIVEMALADAQQRDLVLVYIGDPSAPGRRGSLLEIVDPYLADKPAQDVFRVVTRLTSRSARRRNRHCIYLSQDDPAAAVREVLGTVQPALVLVLRGHGQLLEGLPRSGRRDRVRDGVHVTAWASAPRRYDVPAAGSAGSSRQIRGRQAPTWWRERQHHHHR